MICKDIKTIRGFLIALTGFFLVLSFAIEAYSLPTDDSYLAGYATAVIERELHMTVNNLTVKDGVITIDVGNLRNRNREKIIAALKGIPGIVRIEFSESKSRLPSSSKPVVRANSTETKDNAENKEKSRARLFDPILSDSRWPHFSASYQHYINDKHIKNVGATNFGASFSFYQWDTLSGASWELGLQAGVFAIFNLDAASRDLMNADYWVALPAVSYRKDKVSALVRLYHQSSHLGDEYLLNNRVNRVNLSYEAVDFKLSYDMNEVLRIYGGGGVMVNKEPSNLKPLSVMYGAEYKHKNTYLNGWIRPVAAASLEHHEENNWRGDVSLRTGVQFKSPDRSLRYLLFEYFNGQSPNGQFYERSIKYVGLGAHIYF